MPPDLSSTTNASSDASAARAVESAVNEAASMSDAISIAVSGMLIVGIVLLLISLFIAALPHILAVVAKHWPEVHEHHHSEAYPESQVPDDGEVLAAIGFVLHTEFQRQKASGG